MYNTSEYTDNIIDHYRQHQAFSVEECYATHLCHDQNKTK